MLDLSSVQLSAAKLDSPESPLMVAKQVKADIRSSRRKVKLWAIHDIGWRETDAPIARIVLQG
jgi:hypothetical protein